MPRYVALFRGINVGKAKRIAMADLRALLGKLGCTDVQTLLNSGNAVFTAPPNRPANLPLAFGKRYSQKTGVDALVIVKSAKDMAAIVAGNELEKVATDPSRLLVAITNDNKALKSVAALADVELGRREDSCGQTRRLSVVRQRHSRKQGRWKRCSRASRAPAPRATGPR